LRFLLCYQQILAQVSIFKKYIFIKTFFSVNDNDRTSANSLNSSKHLFEKVKNLARSRLFPLDYFFFLENIFNVGTLEDNSIPIASFATLVRRSRSFRFEFIIFLINSTLRLKNEIKKIVPKSE
jgi:hypothetical protein